MTSGLVVFGLGQIAELAKYYFDLHTDHRIRAFTVDDAYVKEDTFLGLPVVPSSELANKFRPKEYSGFAALSYTGMNKLREEKFKWLKNSGYTPISYVSPKCTNFAKSIGENCFILEDNTLQPFVSIGNNVTLWSGNHIGHHSTIADNNFISSHVVVSGGVTVERNCFIGVNATLRDHITIGSESLIAAGALVIEDTPPKSVILGSKGKRIEKTSDQIEKI